VHWEDGTPKIDFSALDLADRTVRQRLVSGLPQRLEMRVYAYRTGGRDPVAVAVQTCSVVYDLWEEVYRVEYQDIRADRSESYGELSAVLRRCLTAQRMQIGNADNYGGSGRVFFAVMIELNPFSPAQVHRMRRWLARPAGGGRVGGEAFFGSFVSLFVNRRIGSAERTLRFRSQDVRVEP
jgi:hypothetical protein